MIDFPTVTLIHRRLPKEAFYKNLTLTKTIKDKFITDIDKIFVENSLTKDNLNLRVDSTIKEILLLSIFLKKSDFDGKVLEAIAQQNPHRLVFLLRFGDSHQLALYKGKLYRTKWKSEAELELRLNGFSIDEVWDSFVEQIALNEEHSERVAKLTIDERLALQEQIAKLERKIEKTEAATWKEQQPKKRFALYLQLQSYKEKLEELKHG